MILPTHIPAKFGWHPLDPSFWKLNTNVAYNTNSSSGGLGWVLRDHLGRVHLTSFVDVKWWRSLKLWPFALGLAYNTNSIFGGLGWVLQDHLGRVRLTSLKFVRICQMMKVLEAMAIGFGLETLLSIRVSNILVEITWRSSICWMMLSAITKYPFFVNEALGRGGDLGVVLFSCLSQSKRVGALSCTKSFGGSKV